MSSYSMLRFLLLLSPSLPVSSLNFRLALVIQLLGESLQQFEVFDKEVHEGPYFHGHYIKMEDNRQNVIILNVKVPAPSLP